MSNDININIHNKNKNTNKDNILLYLLGLGLLGGTAYIITKPYDDDYKNSGPGRFNKKDNNPDVEIGDTPNDSGPGGTDLSKIWSQISKIPGISALVPMQTLRNLLNQINLQVPVQDLNPQDNAPNLQQPNNIQNIAPNPNPQPQQVQPQQVQPSNNPRSPRKLNEEKQLRLQKEAYEKQNNQQKYKNTEPPKLSIHKEGIDDSISLESLFTMLDSEAGDLGSINRGDFLVNRREPDYGNIKIIKKVDNETISENKDDSREDIDNNKEDIDDFIFTNSDNEQNNENIHQNRPLPGNISSVNNNTNNNTNNDTDTSINSLSNTAQRVFFRSINDLPHVTRSHINYVNLTSVNINLLLNKIFNDNLIKQLILSLMEKGGIDESKYDDVVNQIINVFKNETTRINNQTSDFYDEFYKDLIDGLTNGMDEYEKELQYLLLGPENEQTKKRKYYNPQKQIRKILGIGTGTAPGIAKIIDDINVVIQKFKDAHIRNFILTVGRLKKTVEFLTHTQNIKLLFDNIKKLNTNNNEALQKIDELIKKHTSFEKLVFAISQYNEYSLMLLNGQRLNTEEMKDYKSYKNNLSIFFDLSSDNKIYTINANLFTDTKSIISSDDKSSMSLSEIDL